MKLACSNITVDFSGLRALDKVSLSVETNFLFDEALSKKWNAAYKLLGINPMNLSSDSGRA